VNHILKFYTDTFARDIEGIDIDYSSIQVLVVVVLVVVVNCQWWWWW
jgi:hypothetical protein